MPSKSISSRALCNGKFQLDFSWVSFPIVPRDGATSHANCLTQVPGGILGLGMIFVKESPRWLVKRGRNDQALENLIWVRGGDSEEVQDEFAEIVAGIAEESRQSEGLTYKELLLPSNRYRVFIVISMQLGRFPQFGYVAELG